MRRLMSLVTAGLAVVALAGCGGHGTSTNPQQLLRETFTGAHAVNSGQLQVSVSLQRRGGIPLTVALGGPFQRHGAGTLPSADFTVTAGEAGVGLKLEVISTGHAGYVRFEGASYRLPAADVRQLAGGFASVSATGAAAGETGGPLGLHPLRWLTGPQDAGSATVGGAQTERVTAGVDVPALLTDLEPLLGRAASLGLLGSGGLSAAGRERLAAQIRTPRVELWTGTTDHTIRRLRLSATVPVPARLSSLLGGAASAGAVVTASYTQLNQPQTVTAPTRLAPYADFRRELGAVLSQLGR